MDPGVFNAGFGVLHVFVAEGLSDVLALDGFPVDLREIGVGEVEVVVPDAVVIDADEFVDLSVRKNVLVIAVLGFVLVGSRERDINVVLEQGLCAWLEVAVNIVIDVAGPVQSRHSRITQLREPATHVQLFISASITPHSISKAYINVEFSFVGGSVFDIV